MKRSETYTRERRGLKDIEHLQSTQRDSELFIFYHERVLGKKGLGCGYYWSELCWCRKHLERAKLLVILEKFSSIFHILSLHAAQVLCISGVNNHISLLPCAFKSHTWHHGRCGPLHLGSQAWAGLCLVLIGHRCVKKEGCTKLVR